MNKDRQIVSELRNFFTESGCGLGTQRIMNVLGTINITEKQMAFEKKPNCKFTCAQVIQMMILFPFFSVKNVANYIGSSLQPLFDCHKDIFYRVLSNERIDWRHILRYVNKKLAANIAVRSDARNSEYPTCMIVDDTDMPKTGRKGEWKVLLSTDTSLTPYNAYRIYAMHWSIEVSFHECKSLLKLGKCQCGDFGSQIASISLNMLQYNLLSYVKRFESYETIGGLFREITAQTVELSVTEKIWGLIQQLVSAIADFFSADFDEILTNIIYENKQLKAIMRVAQQLQPAA